MKQHGTTTDTVCHTCSNSWCTPVQLVESVRNCWLCTRRCLACSSYAHVMHCALVTTRVLRYDPSPKHSIMHNCKPLSLSLSCTGYDFLMTRWGEQEYSVTGHFKNACCATNSTSKDIQVSCCRCAYCIFIVYILTRLGVLKIAFPKTISGQETRTLSCNFKGRVKIQIWTSDAGLGLLYEWLTYRTNKVNTRF